VKTKPKGAKYRNLTARSGVIYYQRRANGKRIRFSCKTDDWSKAAAVAQLYEERKGIGRLAFAVVEVPRLGEFAARYLKEDTGHLAATAFADRRRYLDPDGRLLSALGNLRLDEIDPPRLREWWNAEGFGQKGKRTVATGRTYLNTLSGVLHYAEDLRLLESNPVDEFRSTIRRRSRTKRGRLEASTGRNVRPIEDPQDVQQFVDGARIEGLEAYVYVLLGLDAGLRRGEALGLRWGCVVRGRDDDDPTRALVIDKNRPRAGALEAPKSGRERRVALSYRLRGALQALHRLRGEPGSEALVLRSSFHRHEWARIVKRGGIGPRRFKDLRDTFGSQLVSAGVPLPYVSHQLGHADVAVTARHYARWTGGDDYREPVRLLPGELPADLLARLALKSDPTVTPLDETAEGAETANPPSLLS
jgi:integrase